MSDPTLVKLMEHHRWSTGRLLDGCAALDDATLDAERPGSYGSIRRTLLHLLGAEQRYVALLAGGPRPEPLEEQPWPGWAALHATAEASSARLLALAEGFEGAQRVSGLWQGGEPFEMSAWIPFLQAIHHAHEHRTQIASALGQQGIEPPSLSVWDFSGEV